MNRSASAKGSNRSCSSGFDCNICLENVQDPVVTLCGHLYCWPCIYKWLNTSSKNNEKSQCPVCKLEISESTLVPLYGRGKTTSTSKGKAQQEGIDVPSRPLGPSSWLSKLSPRSHDTPTVSNPYLGLPREQSAPEVPRWDIPARNPPLCSQEDRLKRLEDMMEQMMLSQGQAHDRLEHGLNIIYNFVRLITPNPRDARSILCFKNLFNIKIRHHS
jgi:hypothetical protein